MLRSDRPAVLPVDVESLQLLDFGESLGVMTYSIVRPISMDTDLILRLEAPGVPSRVFVENQRAQMRTVGRSLTRRRLFRIYLLPKILVTYSHRSWRRPWSPTARQRRCSRLDASCWRDYDITAGLELRRVDEITAATSRRPWRPSNYA